MSAPPQDPPRPAAPRRPGTLRIGQVAGVDVLVNASWLLVAAIISVLLQPRIEEIAPGLGNLGYVAGLAFAVLLYLSVLVHELAHAMVALAYGLRVRSVTLHFLGGVTEIEEESPRPRVEFLVAVVGPVASLLVGAAAWGLSLVAPDGLPLFACQALALSNVAVGVLNLVPGIPLDGGRVLQSIVWGATGDAVTGSIVAGWAGRVVAVLLLGYPLLLSEVIDVEPTTFDYLFAGILAFFMWNGATQTIASAKVRRRLPRLRAREIARRALTVPDDLPLSEAVERARAAEAGGIVVLDQRGGLFGIVNEKSVLATPEERRPFLAVSGLTRRIEPGTTLAADLTGEALIRAMYSTPAAEYVLVEDDGSVYGVLTTTDVDAAFSRA